MGNTIFISRFLSLLVLEEEGGKRASDVVCGCALACLSFFFLALHRVREMVKGGKGGKVLNCGEMVRDEIFGCACKMRIVVLRWGDVHCKKWPVFFIFVSRRVDGEAVCNAFFLYANAGAVVQSCRIRLQLKQT